MDSILPTIEELAAIFGKTEAGQHVYNVLTKLQEFEQRLKALEQPAQPEAPAPAPSEAESFQRA